MMSSMRDRDSMPWLARYANDYHKWQKLHQGGKICYYRPLGLVEGMFDYDGTYFEGRADVNSVLALEIRSTLNQEDFRRRLQLAWASLRLQHVLLSAKARSGFDLLPLDEKLQVTRFFTVDQPRTVEDVLEDAAKTIQFIDDHYQNIDTDDFFRHVMNTARVVDPLKALAELLVLPRVVLPNGNFQLELILVAAHSITDGVTVHTEMAHLIKLLNLPDSMIMKSLSSDMNPLALQKRLPSAQEDLYPQVSSNPARRHWHWAISIILRHVRRPPPQSYHNPLARAAPLSTAQPMPPTYSAILNYDAARTPPLNSYTTYLGLSPTATHRLQRHCRSAGTSIGAGCFALVAMSMHLLTERKDPSNTLPFTASFPINPRPFLRQTDGRPAESMMLAFSDGITLPFLPSYVPLEKRFKFLARRAHSQLGVFQKRRSTATAAVAEGVKALGPRSASQLIPSLYLSTLERAESRLPRAVQQTVSPQAAYPARFGSVPATCGVSSVGPRWSILAPGMHDLGETGEDFAADFRGLRSCVRVREREFLVGSASDKDTALFGLSYDGNFIDEEQVAEWKEIMVGLLEDRETEDAAKL